MPRVHYDLVDGIGWIDLDDDKMNVMSPSMQADIHAALDRAEADDAVTVVRGRAGVFSAGFDLAILRGGDTDAGARMVLGGFELARRILAHPRPVVMACTGHSVAMGLFLLLSGDYRIGTTAPARLVANEVAIGLTLPRAADVILRHRLTPAAHQRASLLAVPFGPDDAVRDGVLDEVVEPDHLDDRVVELATMLTLLDRPAQVATKARVRAGLLTSLAAAIDQDRAEYETASSPGMEPA